MVRRANSIELGVRASRVAKEAMDDGPAEGAEETPAPAPPPAPSRQSSIMAVMRDPNLSAEEKRRRVQELYKGWNATALGPTPTSAQRAPVVSYFDEEKKIMGCKHYQRGCAIECPRCRKVYTCRHCHNAAEDHEIDRKKVERMRCMRCNLLQPVAAACSSTSCGAKMAKYFCRVCNFFDDDPNKNIYHCDGCGLCRVGPRENYKHCDRCGSCVPRAGFDEHKCFKSSMTSNCPICGEFLFNSTKPAHFLQCGHCMHQECFSRYIRFNYTCPICRKSILSAEDRKAFFWRIDMEVRQHQMPVEYDDLVAKIVCNDCESHSVAKYHFFYHKCGSCGSYNTHVLSKVKRESKSGEGASGSGAAGPSSAGGSGGSAAAPAPRSQSVNMITTGSSGAARSGGDAKAAGGSRTAAMDSPSPDARGDPGANGGSRAEEDGPSDQGQGDEDTDNVDSDSGDEPLWGYLVGFPPSSAGGEGAGQEHVEMVNEVGEAIGQTISDDVDNEELEQEMAEMENQMIDEDLLRASSVQGNAEEGQPNAQSDSNENASS